MNGRVAARATLATVAAVACSTASFASPNDTLRPGGEGAETVTRGQAEFGVGLLTLPGAEVCIERSLGCTRGDSSFVVTARPLFRRGNFAVGVGIMLGLTSSSDAPRNDPPDVPRDHWRRYLAADATARYYLPLTQVLDGWVGLTTGLGVVSDTFQPQAGLTEQALVGPRALVIITEGATLGIEAGLTHALSDNWLVGGGIRASEWFLPTTPARDPLGDDASLTGLVTTLEIGVTLAYRSTLVF